MPINAIYKGPDDLPGVIAIFPLAGALLLPRGQMPLNIFEPRYLAMVDDALRSGSRLIGMIQPDPVHPGPDKNKPHLFSVGCVGRSGRWVWVRSGWIMPIRRCPARMASSTIAR